MRTFDKKAVSVHEGNSRDFLEGDTLLFVHLKLQGA
jgi:hypothetical protein